MNNYKWTPLAIALAMSASLSHATSNPSGDVDIDNDGLIEIATLQELDLMRYDLAGTSLNGDSTGCPATGCNGYELIADLDFDTNGNGVVDAGDDFWNDGKGWLPINGQVNSSFYPFTAILEGNYHTVSNLTILNNTHGSVGFFRETQGAVVKNITFDSPVVDLNDNQERANYAGVISGKMIDSQILNIELNDIKIEGYGYAGGVTGSFKSDQKVENIHVSGVVNARTHSGGIFGYLKGQLGPESLEVLNISFTGNVFAWDAVAGIANSLSNVRLNGCSVTGDIGSHGHNTAGLAVQVKQSLVSDCHISANVHVTDFEGDRTYSYFTGGFFSEMGTSTLELSSFEGDISSVGRYAGGIAGAVTGIAVVRNVSIVSDIRTDDCCSGGLFGAVYSRANDLLESVILDNIIIAGNISANSSGLSAGIFGANWVSNEDVLDAFDVQGVYWDMTLSGISNSGVNGINVGGEGKSTHELQCSTMPGDVTCNASMYADWDETIWDFGDSSDYPRLIGDSDNDGYRDDEDIDDDNDGLIDIATLQQLDLMRYDLAGTSLNGDSTGCPATGCNGYELIADLDFDTNGNGVVDAGDDFWNDGKGWLPINGQVNSSFYPFTAILEGNYHTVSNLTILNNTHGSVGFFRETQGAVVKNITFDSPVVDLNDNQERANYAGVISGKMIDSQILNIELNDIKIEGYGYAGGVTGSFKSDQKVENIHVSGVVNARTHSGGIFGYLKGQLGPESLEVLNISFTGNVFAWDAVAGIANSLSNVRLNGCSVTGDIGSHGHNTAGLAVQVKQSLVSDCHISANVHVTDFEGDRTYSYFTGGFFSEMGTSTLELSSFEGDISSVGRYAGGIAGAVTGIAVVRNVSIVSDIRTDDCCSGGLFGAVYSRANDLLESVILDNIIIAGNISANSSGLSAGIFGANWVSNEDVLDAFDVQGVYWDMTLSGISNSGVNGINVGGEGKSTHELQCSTMPGDVTCNASMYADWDETIWDFGTSSDYPVLR